MKLGTVAKMATLVLGTCGVGNSCQIINPPSTSVQREHPSNASVGKSSKEYFMLRDRGPLAMEYIEAEAIGARVRGQMGEAAKLSAAYLEGPGPEVIIDETRYGILRYPAEQKICLVGVAGKNPEKLLLLDGDPTTPIGNSCPKENNSEDQKPPTEPDADGSYKV